MHGTTEIAFFVKDGVIFAVDSRSTAMGSKIESHRIQNKVHRFRDNLYATKCGRNGDIREMFKYLDLMVSPTIESVADEVYDYIQRDPSKTIGSLIVGYDKQGCKIFKVLPDCNNPIPIDKYAAIGSGKAAASWVLKDRHLRNDMELQDGLQLARDVMTEAALCDKNSGGWLSINFLRLNGICEEHKETVLENYLRRYKHHQSFISHNQIKHRRERSALYILIPDSPLRDVILNPVVIGKFFHKYGGLVQVYHCLGWFGKPVDVCDNIPEWREPYHFHRVEFDNSEVADKVYSLAKEQWEKDKERYDHIGDFGTTEATYIDIFERRQGKPAIICVESEKMLKHIMTYSPWSWKSIAKSKSY